MNKPANTVGSSAGISVRGLRRSFGDHQVLKGIDLDIDAGTIFGLLGPNGAGKTTVVNILSTLIPADAGDVTISGHYLADDPVGVRRAIGVTGQFSAVDNLLTGIENLALMADLNHLPKAQRRKRASDLLERFDLVEAAKKPAMTYSGGMRRRLDLAMSLMGNPQIIFLDEPTTGLDPRSRRTMWQMIGELVADGVTILLTTQYLEEADELASRVGLLDGGTIVAEGTPDELKRRVAGGHVLLKFADQRALASAKELVTEGVGDDNALSLQVPSDGGLRSLKSLFDRLDDDSIEVTELTVHTPDLDDVFLAFTGHATSQHDTPASTDTVKETAK